jgi:hypothetical protein
MGKADYFKDGDWNGICDYCGFKFKFSKLKKTWDGYYACRKCWEPRQPQDFVRGVLDDQSVPDSRPDQDPTFVEGAQNLPLPEGND